MKFTIYIIILLTLFACHEVNEQANRDESMNSSTEDENPSNTNANTAGEAAGIDNKAGEESDPDSNAGGPAGIESSAGEVAGIESTAGEAAGIENPAGEMAGTPDIAGEMAGIDMTAGTVAGADNIAGESAGTSDVQIDPMNRFVRGIRMNNEPALPDQLVPVAEDITPLLMNENRVELVGKLFYNDLRNNGLYHLRQDPDGVVGSKIQGDRADWANLLGALDVVVDVYEVDTAQGDQCQRSNYITSSSVAQDGSFRIILNIDDPCTDQSSNHMKLALAFRLKSCHEWHCFAAVDDELKVYRLWLPHANVETPLDVSIGNTYQLGEFLFSEDLGEDELLTGDYDQAANVFASIVDIARWAHRQEGINAQPNRFNMLKVRFPSTGAPRARASGASLIHILKPSRYFANNGLFHEYGHTLNFRAFGGGSGGCSQCEGGQYERNGNSNWSPSELEYPYAAFKEGWANFIAKAILNRCGGNFDDNGEIEILGGNNRTGLPNNSDGYPRNITKFLCDWLDGSTDDDLNLPGNGDVLQASVGDMEQLLRHMWNNISDRDSLDTCSVIRWYIDPTNNPPATDAGRASRFEQMRSTAFQNGLECGLPLIE